MLNKSSKKIILIFALSCLLSLGIGVGLGYGLQTGGLLGTAVTDEAGEGLPVSSDALGASRPIYDDDVYVTCPNCNAVSLTPILTPVGGPICPACGKRIPR